MHKLSNRMEARLDGGCVTLHDSGRFIIITSEEMQALIILYTDGCCPVCFEEIPDGDVVCNKCHEAACTNRWLNG